MRPHARLISLNKTDKLGALMHLSTYQHSPSPYVIRELQHTHKMDCTACICSPCPPARTRPATVQLHRAGSCDKHRYARPSKGSTRLTRQRSSRQEDLTARGPHASRPEVLKARARSSRRRKGRRPSEGARVQRALQLASCMSAPCLCHPAWLATASLGLLPRTLLST